MNPGAPVAEPTTAGHQQPPSRAARYGAIVALVAACALSIAGVMARDHRQARVPTADQQKDAAKKIREGYRAGDVIRVVPDWSESTWHHLTFGPGGVKQDKVPALHLGGRVDPLELLRGKRLWVLALFGNEPIIDSDEFALDLGAPLETEAFGEHVSVALYQLPTQVAVARLTDDVARLKVSRRPLKGAVKTCKRRGKKFKCSAKWWLNIEAKDDDVYHRAVHWLHAVPSTDQGTAVIEWPLKGRKAKEVVIRAGNTLRAARGEGGTTVRITVFVDGETKGALHLEPNRYEMARLKVPVGDNSLVRLEIWATNHHERHIMLQGDAYAEPLPEFINDWIAAGATGS